MLTQSKSHLSTEKGPGGPTVSRAPGACGGRPGPRSIRRAERRARIDCWWRRSCGCCSAPAPGGCRESAAPGALTGKVLPSERREARWTETWPPVRGLGRAPGRPRLLPPQGRLGGAPAPGDPVRREAHGASREGWRRRALAPGPGGGPTGEAAGRNVSSCRTKPPPFPVSSRPPQEGGATPGGDQSPSPEEGADGPGPRRDWVWDSVS